MPTRVYHLTLPRDFFEIFDSVTHDGRKCRVTCCCNPDFKGFQCATQPPRSHNLTLSNDEIGFESATILNPQLLELRVNYDGNETSGPAFQEVEFMKIRATGSSKK